jgi:FtsZ-interacting cell division protein ZipA
LDKLIIKTSIGGIIMKKNKINLNSVYLLLSILLIIAMVFVSCDKDENSDKSNKNNSSETKQSDSNSPKDTTETKTEDPKKTSEIKNSKNIEFTTIAKGDDNGIEKEQNVIVTTEEKFNTLWNKTNSIEIDAPKDPKIDFSKSSVIAVYMGTKDSAGYSISIEKVSIVNNELNITVKTIEPQKNESVAAVITSPYHIVEVPFSVKNMEVQWNFIK